MTGLATGGRVDSRSAWLPPRGCTYYLPQAVEEKLKEHLALLDKINEYVVDLEHDYDAQHSYESLP